MTTLVLVLKKIGSDDKTKYGTSFTLKAEAIVNQSDIDVFESIYTKLYQTSKNI